MCRNLFINKNYSRYPVFKFIGLRLMIISLHYFKSRRINISSLLFTQYNLPINSIVICHIREATVLESHTLTF